MKEKLRYGQEKLFIGPRFGDKFIWGRKTTAFKDDTGITWVKVIESNGGEEKGGNTNSRRDGRNGRANTKDVHIPPKEGPLK